MVHVRIDPAEIRLDGFFQTGGGGVGQTFEGRMYQRGYGWFAGMPRQRGSGLGDVFRRLWRYLRPMAGKALPVIKDAGKALGEEGLAAAARVLDDVSRGANLKESVLNEGKEGVINLLGRAEKKLSQKGRGIKRRRKRSRGVIFKPNDVVGGVVAAKAIGGQIKSKKKRVDTFGAY